MAKVTPAPPVAGEVVDRRPLPKLTGRVVDGAHLLPAASASALVERLRHAELQTCHQFVVVTVPSLAGEPIERFGRRLGNGWGIGRLGYDDGVLLIVAPAEHRVRIEVGNGLRKQLSDAECARIIQTDILPRFRAGDMAGGIEAGVTSILREIR